MISNQFTPLPDEHIYSWTARLFRLSGYPSVSSFLKRYNGSFKNLNANYAFESAAFSIIKNSESAEKKQKLLWKNTIFPVSLISIPNQASYSLNNHFNFSELSDITHMNEQLLFGFSRNWHACSSCMTEDEEKYGMSYWHVEHQLPSVISCQKHNRILLKPTDGLKNLSTLTLPFLINSWVPIIDKPASSILEWNNFILKVHQLSIEDKLFISRLRCQINDKIKIESKYRNKRIDWCDEHTLSFETALGKSLLKHLFRAYSVNSKSGKPRILASFLAPQNNGLLLRNPVYWLALAYWLKTELPQLDKVFNYELSSQF
tara:strand:+ start:2227 stop:3177 length:951 start_codon:yes stop_codon:yes gene_type:complete